MEDQLDDVNQTLNSGGTPSSFAATAGPLDLAKFSGDIKRVSIADRLYVNLLQYAPYDGHAACQQRLSDADAGA